MIFGINKSSFRFLGVVFVACFAQNTLFSHEIIIQPDYWTGTESLINGVPWQVPCSIYKEDENCKADDMVLEFGAGGSTVFFAKRCKHVLSVETNPEWALLVRDQLQKLNLQNVTLICIKDQVGIEQFIHNLEVSNITVLSVDSDSGYNRSAFLSGFLGKGISKNLRMVVLDNYAAPELFQQYDGQEVMNLNEWSAFTYDDERWFGNGTKIYIRKER